MSTNNRISNLVSSQVPFFVRNDHQTFVRFLESYYEYLEQTGKSVEVSKNIRSYQDIDRTLDQYADKLYAEYMKLVPTNMLADKSIVMKHIKDFYLSRGTEKSIEFLLRILFGLEDVEFYYPKKDILRASDGKWYIQRTLRVSDVVAANVANISLYALEKFVNKAIYGANSGATAIGERVDQFYDAGTLISEISVSGIVGTFENGEQIYAYYDGIPFANGSTTVVPTYTITANVFGGILNTITISNPGTGYDVGDPVVIESNTGTGATAIVSKVSTGNVSSIVITEGGAGYQANDYLLITGGGGSGANGEVTIVLKDGSVHPNSYNIYFETISLEANTPIANATSNGIYESFAYQNLRVQYTITSNLFANTFTSLSAINLTQWLANSNTYFETFDSLNLTNQISGVSNTVLITSSNIISNVVFISPAYSSPQNDLTIQVIKRANANTTIANSLNSYSFSNVGPASVVRINNPGAGYTSTPTVAIQGNTSIVSLGILGRMRINNGGAGYVAGDKIEFINIIGGYGVGALGNVRTVNVTGSITNVEFIAITGHPVGGTGYDQNYLPVANVVSGTGTGANISVTNILGTGGSFLVANSVIGAIETISITNRGSGYTFIPTINLTQSGDGTAIANATIIEGVFEYSGRWLNDDGHLSSYNFLEDRDYYQPYSYVIRVGKSIADYRKALKDLVHPAGMKLFGEHTSVDNQETYVYKTEATTDEIITTSTRTYFSNVNTLINFASHGLSIGNTVYLKFTSGNVINSAISYGSEYQPNGIYTVSAIKNNDAFYINSGINRLPATMNVYITGLGVLESSYQEVYVRKDPEFDGKILYLYGTSRDVIYEYRMSKAGDITSFAGFSNISPQNLVENREQTARGFDISRDGKYVYFVGGTSGNTRRGIYQFAMTKNWDITTLTDTANSYNLVPQLTAVPNQVAVKVSPTGNSVYIADTTNDTIYQYALNENWNIATATLQTQKYIGNIEGAISGFDFNYGGNTVYLSGLTNDKITTFKLDVAWNVNTANFSTLSNSASFVYRETGITGMGVSADETMIYITAAGTGSNSLHQFPMGKKANVNTLIILAQSSGNVRVSKLV